MERIYPIISLEQMLRNNPQNEYLEGSEFILRVQFEESDGSIRAYVRPSDRDGDTFDFKIKGNNIDVIF